MQAVTHIECISSEMGRPLYRNRRSQETLIREEIICTARDLYQRGLLDIPRFLACASYFLRALNERLIVFVREDEFIVINENPTEEDIQRKYDILHSECFIMNLNLYT